MKNLIFNVPLYTIFLIGRFLRGTVEKDKKYLKILYKYKMKKNLNVDNPKTFNEKLQWLKLYDRNPRYIEMVDKFEAKEYVKKQIGEEYIVPTYGIWNDFESIDFTSLPDQFVLKCTHDSGGLVICSDKQKLNVEKARKKINHCLKRNYFWNTREWPYKNVKPRIIAEKYMEDQKEKELRDYKFYCFDGVPLYLYVSEGLRDHKTAKIDFFDMDFKRAPFKRDDYRHFENMPKKPLNFEKMKKLAAQLSRDIPFLRVDFYEVDGQIYFSELTFFPVGGTMPFTPEIWDEKLGKLIKLPK